MRNDIASFDRRNEVPGAFETMEVHIPWLNGDQVLSFPTSEDQLVQWGGATFAGQGMIHAEGAKLDIFRVNNLEHMNQSAPRREGVIIQTESVTLMILSASALEYYYDDADDKRALQYSHLDFDVRDIQDISSVSGLLPEIWGIVPTSKQTLAHKSLDGEMSSSVGEQPPLPLRRPILRYGTPQHHADNQALQMKMLAEMLSPSVSVTDDRTAAVVCSGLQCDRPSMDFL